MEYRQLGRTDLQVSELCLGTMQWGWTANEQAARQVMDAFVEAGGNFLDTADVYSRWAPGNPGGISESIIGRWASDRGLRRQLVIATKVRGRMWEGLDGEGLSRAHIVKAVEASLRRLQTDYLDLYQAHSPDQTAPIEETMEAFDRLVGQGKVRYLGASNYSAGELGDALVASAARGGARYDALQPHYNLVHREEFERELRSYCEAEGLGVIPYSPLAGGFLSGKYRRGQPPPESERAGGVQSRFYENPQAWETLRVAEEIAGAHGKTVLQVALAWLLSQPVITAPIVGANSPEQLENILGAVGFRLSIAEMEQLAHASEGDHPGNA